MQTDCGNKCNLTIQDNKICCIRHLVMKCYYNSTQITDQKNSIYFYRCLKDISRNHNFQFNIISTELFAGFLELIARFSAQFFMQNEKSYAKLLIKIGLTGCNETALNNNINIKARKFALLNNLACLYNTRSTLKKCEKFFKAAEKYATNNFDLASVYNNLTKVYLDLGNISMAKKYTGLTNDAFSPEITQIKDEIKSGQKQVDFLQRAECCSFIIYNHGSALYMIEEREEVTNEDRKSNNIFYRGYRLSKLMLGENHYLTEKYRIRETKYFQCK